MKAKQAMAVILAASMAVSTATVSAMAQEEQETEFGEAAFAYAEEVDPAETDGMALQIVEGITEAADEMSASDVRSDEDGAGGLDAAEDFSAEALVLDAVDAGDDGGVPADGIFSEKDAPDMDEAVAEEDAEDTGDMVGVLEEAVEAEDAQARSTFWDEYKNCAELKVDQTKSILVKGGEGTGLLIKPTKTGIYEIISGSNQDVEPDGFVYDQSGEPMSPDNYIDVDGSLEYLLHLKLEAGKTYVLISNIDLDGESTIQVTMRYIQNKIDQAKTELNLDQPMAVHYDGTVASGAFRFNAPADGEYSLLGSEGVILNADVYGKAGEVFLGLYQEQNPLCTSFWAEEGESILIFTENSNPAEPAEYVLTLTMEPEEDAEAHTHSFKWTTTRQATVFAAGLETGTCSACGETQAREIARLTPTVSLNVSGTLPLKKGQKSSAVQVSDLAAGDSVKTVTSSKTKVAEVSEANGVLTLKGKKTGKATITVTLASGHTVSFKVKVQKAQVKTKKISVAAKKVQLEKGQTFALNAAVIPITSKQKLTYSSSQSKVASVSRGGVITAKKKGKATITVKSGKKMMKIKVTVR